MTENIERSKEWTAWQGDKEVLKRLCNVIQAFAQNQLNEALAGIAAENEMPAVLEMKQDYARQRWVVTARATEEEFSRTRSGTPDEVIDALDERTVNNFSVDLRAYWEDHSIVVEVSFRRSAGCVVRVRGSDPIQIHSLFPEIESAVKRGVPGWQWLRRDAMFFPYWVFSTLLLGYALYPYTGDIKDPSIANRLTISYLSAGLVGVFCGFGLVSLTKRLFPGFEVTRPGAEGKGSRRLVLAFTLVAGAVLSWVISHLK